MKTQEKQDKIVEIATKWGRVGLLDGLDSEEQDRVAVLLENQRIWNENEEGGNPQWRRVSIPFIHRVFRSCIPAKIVSMQPMLEPTCMYLWRDKYGSIKRGSVGSRTRFLDVPVQKIFEKDELKSEYNLDHEAEATAKAAEYAQNAIQQEIFNDLAAIAAGTRLTHEWQNEKKFLDFIRLAASKTGKTIGLRSNWAIIPDRFFKALKTDEGFEEVSVGGVLDGNLRIYPRNQHGSVIVMGYRGDQYNAGYFYCPFIMGILDEQHNRIAVRYGKTCNNKGYYTRIDVKGYSDTISVEDVREARKIEEETGVSQCEWKELKQNE